MQETVSAGNTFLRMEHVDVARREAVVLHDITLSIAVGESVAILGPNGCGKSTLIKAITCECYPIADSRATLQLYGRTRWDVSQLRQHLGVVSADLPGERTPVTRGLEAVVAGFFSASMLWPNLHVTEAMWHRAAESLELMRAGHVADKLVGHMSAGEQRRVMIARALVHRPAMLLLDEPSNALDLAAQRELREALRNVACGQFTDESGKGTGIVMVTHHLADILPEIDRVILIKDGRIFADGSKRLLITPDSLAELFGVKLELVERDGYWHPW